MIIRRLRKNISLLLKNLLIEGMDGMSERRKRDFLDFSGRHFGEVLTECYKCKDPWCVCVRVRSRLGHINKAKNLRGQSCWGYIT